MQIFVIRIFLFISEQYLYTRHSHYFCILEESKVEFFEIWFIHENLDVGAQFWM
jgi:hypothetical protein